MQSFSVRNDNLELIKWVAALLMVVDHINKYLLGDSHPIMFDAGRLAMPLFVFVLSYNLARNEPNTLYESKTLALRMTKRLFAFGLIATPIYIALGGVTWGWWPLNILFGLCAVSTLVCFIQRKFYVAAVVFFFAAGFFVEFFWPLLGLGLALWFYFRKPSVGAALFAGAFLVSLRLINGNYWALAAVPLFLVLCAVSVKVPRVRWFFYAFYPLHLAVILGIKLYVK
ncbi:MAG TPA: TraX family protein [Methylobacter sp.]